MYITRASKIDKHLIPDIRNNLNAGNLDMAISVVERSGSAHANVLKEEF
jgi:biopolymer transport protein ExbB